MTIDEILREFDDKFNPCLKCKLNIDDECHLCILDDCSPPDLDAMKSFLRAKIEESQREAVRAFDKKLLWTSANAFLPVSHENIDELTGVAGTLMERREAALAEWGIKE